MKKGRFRTETTDAAPLAADPSAFVLKMSRTWSLFCIAFSRAVPCCVRFTDRDSVGLPDRFLDSRNSRIPVHLNDSSAHNVLPPFGLSRTLPGSEDCPVRVRPMKN